MTPFSRRAVIQQLQALQCAGLEDISGPMAEKLLKEVEMREKAAVSPEFSGESSSEEKSSASSSPSVSPSVSEAVPEKARPAVPGNVQPVPWQKNAFPQQTPVKPAAGSASASRRVPPSASPASSSAPSAGTPSAYTPSRSSYPMAPKKAPVSLEIIPPHEDYSSLIMMEDRREALRLLAEKVAQCVRCIELVSNRTQTVMGVGNPYASLMFLGEAPGADEDKQGVPFVGRAGKLLTAMIENGMKIKREEETYICNILRCRPPGNRAPLPEEAYKCRRFLDTQIDIVKPKFICCLGASAAQYLLDTTTTISRMRLREYHYRTATVVCTYHPAYLLRNPAQKAATWEDLQFLMKLMEEKTS